VHKVLFVFVLAAALVIPVSAKRVAPKPVPPVLSGNIVYSAQGDGLVGYVVADDVATGKELWRVEVFRIHLKRGIEHDLQWVFISALQPSDNALLVQDERLRCYRVDLATKHVRRSRCH
jgi:hypothetical protein